MISKHKQFSRTHAVITRVTFDSDPLDTCHKVGHRDNLFMFIHVFRGSEGTFPDPCAYLVPFQFMPYRVTNNFPRKYYEIRHMLRGGAINYELSWQRMCRVSTSHGDRSSNLPNLMDPDCCVHWYWHLHPCDITHHVTSPPDRFNYPEWQGVKWNMITWLACWCKYLFVGKPKTNKLHREQSLKDITSFRHFICS